MGIVLKLTGLFLGVLLRTWLPYIRKLKQGKIERFNKKYLTQALGAAAVAAIATLLLLPQYGVEFEPVFDFASGIKVFATAFAFGFGANTLINELLKWQDKGYEGK